ncbi:hypothetical protein [Streptomyces sp. IMTB 2501]|uniref:hypothetical protein n=1 Tax=Streptomyces sp. IMTB 2501 TaxID=1776340 RepID=UPI0015B9441E|nr:hypothetical protein [Streptomyces sp. IMTB 2501]
MAALCGRTVRDLRQGSRGTVLQRLYVDGPMSRHTLEPATGLISRSLSNAVTGLLAEGLAEEAGAAGTASSQPNASWLGAHCDPAAAGGSWFVAQFPAPLGESPTPHPYNRRR